MTHLSPLRLAPWLIALCAMVLWSEAAWCDPTPPASVELPITQTLMRNGAIRYSVWLTVGSRFVEAGLDTGSTGLRVLPAVMPGDLTGLPTEEAYGSGVNLKGLVIPTHVEMGSLAATVPIEIVDHADCTSWRPSCPAKGRGGDYRIMGDDAADHGFSAILGIGFTGRSHDIPNPLESLGAHQWIVELPRPDEPAATGRLILNPSLDKQKQFSMAPVKGTGDFFGCLQTKKPEQMICGSVLLDTGAPTMIVFTDDAQSATVWPAGTAATFRFPGGLKLNFESGGEKDMTLVGLSPAKAGHGQDAPFILAGVYPYFTYDVLYDAAAQKVGLADRATFVAPTIPIAAASAPVEPGTVDAMPDQDAKADPSLGAPIDLLSPAGSALPPKPRHSAMPNPITPRLAGLPTDAPPARSGDRRRRPKSVRASRPDQRVFADPLATMTIDDEKPAAF